MKKRWGLAVCAVVGLLTISARTVHAAADWDDDEDAGKGAKPAVHVRSYPGSADEQDLKVQAVLPASGRYPDSPAHPEKGHAVDDDGNPTDD